MTTFADLGLLPRAAQAVAEQGYTTPTPIQEQAIPLVLAGRDVMGGAQTGTGKTAGFALPLLQRLAPHASTIVVARAPSGARAGAHADARARGAGRGERQGLRQAPAAAQHAGLRRRDMKPQIEALRRGVEILVATPGRLLDHVQNKTLKFNQVAILVLDEADRMLDMGFLPDIKRIIALLPQPQQNLLFSATFPEEIRTLCRLVAAQPGRGAGRRRKPRWPSWSPTCAPGGAREEARAARPT